MNRGIRVLQTLALPLGYVTIWGIYIICDPMCEGTLYFQYFQGFFFFTYYHEMP